VEATLFVGNSDFSSLYGLLFLLLFVCGLLQRH